MTILLNGNLRLVTPSANRMGKYSLFLIRKVEPYGAKKNIAFGDYALPMNIGCQIHSIHKCCLLGSILMKKVG